MPENSANRRYRRKLLMSATAPGCPLAGGSRRSSEYAARHLIEKAKSGKNVERWLKSVERHLTENVFITSGKDRDLAAITTADVAGYF